MAMIRVSWEEVAAIELYGQMCKTSGCLAQRWGEVHESTKEDMRRYVRTVRRLFEEEQKDESS